MKKKAQIQMGETIVIIFIFIVLVAVGIIAYVKVQLNNQDDAMNARSALSATEVALKVLYLPEIRCSFDDVPTHNCIDLGKLVAFMGKDPIEQASIAGTDRHYTAFPTTSITSSALEQFFLEYYDLFGQSVINLSIIYPLVDAGPPYDKVEYILYDQRPENPQQHSKKSTFIPVSTYNSREEEGYRFGYGILEVVTYSGGAS